MIVKPGVLGIHHTGEAKRNDHGRRKEKKSAFIWNGLLASDRDHSRLDVPVDQVDDFQYRI